MTEEQFSQVAERYLDLVYRIALNALRDHADAEDAAQNVMVRLWRSGTVFQDEEHLRRWLARVTVNECRRLAVQPWRKRTVPLEEQQAPAFDDPAQSQVWEAVAALPPKYRLPLYFYYCEGYTVSEVGELLGLKPSTVQTRLARGREKLKTMLTEG